MLEHPSGQVRSGAANSMGRTLSRRNILLCAGAPLFGVAAKGQSILKSGKRNDDYVRVDDLPHFLSRYHAALGERLQKVGMERLVSIGTLRENGNDKPTVLAWELPGKFRLEKDGKAILGSVAGLAAPSSPGVSTSEEDDLMESLFLDRSEAALIGVVGGAAIRVVGYHVRAQRGHGADYAGPYYDIFDFTSKVGSKPVSPTRSKRFYFDSFSGLLQKVSYVLTRGGGSQIVETTLGQWTKVQGESVPGVIERFVNQVSVARFSASATVVSEKKADGKFDKA